MWWVGGRVGGDVGFGVVGFAVVGLLVGSAVGEKDGRWVGGSV